MAFNPNEHLMEYKRGNKTSDYLEVKWRLVWFRELCPEGTIETEEVVVDLDRECDAEVFVWNAEKKHSEKVIKKGRGYARFRAVVTDGKGGKATGTKTEDGANFADYCEKAETGAIGRALAMLGYGTQFTGDELAEHHRIVDAPCDTKARTNQQSDSLSGNSNATTNVATEQQIISLRKLCEHLGKPVPENVTSLNSQEARTLISQYSTEYAALRKVAKGEDHPSKEASSKEEDLTARLNRLCALALEKNVIAKGTSKENGQKFLSLCSKILSATITASEQLTASRLDTIEKYLNEKPVAQAS